MPSCTSPLCAKSSATLRASAVGTICVTARSGCTGRGSHPNDRWRSRRNGSERRESDRSPPPSDRALLKQGVRDAEHGKVQVVLDMLEPQAEHRLRRASQQGGASPAVAAIQEASLVPVAVPLAQVVDGLGAEDGRILDPKAGPAEEPDVALPLVRRSGESPYRRWSAGYCR